jgi:hypothetical protein
VPLVSSDENVGYPRCPVGERFVAPNRCGINSIVVPSLSTIRTATSRRLVLAVARDGDESVPNRRRTGPHSQAAQPAETIYSSHFKPLADRGRHIPRTAGASRPLPSASSAARLTTTRGRR